MKVLLFGATGMVGQGVLRECLLDARVESVAAVGRGATGQQHPKLSEIVRPDLFDLTPIEDRLGGFDACFFCLGITSVGTPKDRYRAITHALTTGIARALLPRNPAMTFIYVSGAGTDSGGRSGWARVKGQTEDELLAMGFRAACMFRPALIVPQHGIRSKTWWYQAFYDAARPLLPRMRAWLPKYVTTTEQVGRAMIEVARHGPPKPVLENIDINRIQSQRS